MTIEFTDTTKDKDSQFYLPLPRILVCGLGGAGCNAVNNMIRQNLEGVEFVVANTDNQSLMNSLCKNRIQLGAQVTNGLGAGSQPDRGLQAAEESEDEIAKYLDNVNMVFITAGMGGGTGTGAAPVVAKIAKQKGILTVGVVTKPFAFERDNRMSVANIGIEEMAKDVDTLIVIPNQNLFRVAEKDTKLTEAFTQVDNVLLSGIRCVTELITNPGLINLDFADVKAIMQETGRAVMGTGQAKGEDRARRAAEAAITNPILEHSSIKGAKGMLINVTGGADITLYDINDAVDYIAKEISPKALLKFGSAIDESLEDEVRVSIIATGIEDKSEASKTFSQASARQKDEGKMEKQNNSYRNEAYQRDFNDLQTSEPVRKISSFNEDGFISNTREDSINIEERREQKDNDNFLSINTSYRREGNSLASQVGKNEKKHVSVVDEDEFLQDDVVGNTVRIQPPVRSYVQFDDYEEESSNVFGKIFRKKKK